MKKFRLKLSTSLIVLLCLVAVLSLAGAGWNVYNVFATAAIGGGKTWSYLLITALTVLIFVLALSVLLFGRYVIKDGKLTVYFGLIPSTSKLEDVVAINHFKLSDKLVIYFKDAKYSVIIISPKDYDKFVLAIREANPKITFESKNDNQTD